MAAYSKNKATCISWEDFLAVHRPQLQSIGLPEPLWQRLYKKLTPFASCDSTEAFEVRDDEQSVSPGCWSLRAKCELQKFSDVFLVEHTWSSDGSWKAKAQLQKSPDLLARMKEMLHRTKERDVDCDLDEFLDSAWVLTQLGGVDENKARETLKSTNGELIEALCQITDDSYLTKKSAKSDESTAMTFAEFKTGFLHAVGMEKAQLLSEEYVQKMYSKYKREKEQYPESLGFGSGTTPNYSWSEEEEGAMTVHVSLPVNTKKSDVLSKLSTKHWTLGLKGREPIIDGQLYGNVCPDESFWTFDAPGLLVMNLQKPENEESELWPVLIKGEKHLTEKEITQQVKDKRQTMNDDTHAVLGSMWFYNQTYQAVTPGGEKQERVWYIMDRIGSALQHSNMPNVKCSPFAFAVTGVFYSLLWPLEDLSSGELCTRNFCPQLSPLETELQRKARLLAFQHPFPKTLPNEFMVELSKFPAQPKENDVTVNVIPLSSETESKNCSVPKISLDMKFYVDGEGKNKKQVLQGLGCTFAASVTDADAAWLERMNGLGHVHPDTKVNRLKGEENLLFRQLISAHILQVWGRVPWFATSYDLSVDLPAVCADHYNHSVSSCWVVRPADPSTLDIRPVVTSDLRRVMRVAETGHMVASHYFPNTALFKKRLFCLQYAVVVKSLMPLELYIHNTPYISQAEKEFDNRSFLDEYDLSAVVTSNPGQDTNGFARQSKEAYQEFLKDLKSTYLATKQFTWDEVQRDIYKSIAKLFYAVAPSLSSHRERQSAVEALSAVYGVDVLLKDSLEHLIIGVNPSPLFNSETSFAEVLVTAFGRNGKCQASVNVTRVSLN